MDACKNVYQLAISCANMILNRTGNLVYNKKRNENLVFAFIF